MWLMGKGLEVRFLELVRKKNWGKSRLRLRLELHGAVCLVLFLE
jgi:hypothetical protein